MAEPLNFNKARKAKVQAEAKAEAARNRVKFGRTKAEKRLASTEADKARAALDGAKRET